MKSNSKERIAITGIGMISSIGYTALSSTMAVLAGIMNFQYHERVMVNADEYGTVLKGASVARMPGNFIPLSMQGTDRALALVVPALKEAVTGVPAQMLEKAYCRIHGPVKDADIFVQRLSAEMPLLPKQNGEKNQEHKELGRCQSFEDIIKAVNDLQNGRHELALIACVDSLLEESILMQLAEDGRLLEGSNPEGIIAGEASGAILLETESHARKRDTSIYAFIEGWGAGTEPNSLSGPNASQAKGLCDAFIEAFENTKEDSGTLDMIINDLNGERPRALEWSLASLRVLSEAGNYTLMHPADCLGECGGAMGIAMVVLASGIMLMKREAPQRIALSTSDEKGARRVLFLKKGDQLDRIKFVNRETNMGTLDS